MAFNLEALQKAQYLCSPAGEKKINESRHNPSSSSINYDDIPTETYLTENDMYRQGHVVNNGNTGRPRTINETALPDVIKQSFSNLEIDVNHLNPQYQQTKAFDDIVETLTREHELSSQYPEPQMVNEAIYSHPNSNNSGIDYNLIAQIIDECLDRKLKTLNESTLKGIRLKDGKISLQDHSGNLYAAKLELKGNVNQKK